MFIQAIEKASKFTRPIHTISRNYKSKEAVPGAATVFLVNDEGWAITCRHVIQLIISSDNLNLNYRNFRNEAKTIKDDLDFETKLIGLEQKYGYNESTTIQVKNIFVDCADKITAFNWHVHPQYDIALLQFKGFNKIFCNEFATFRKNPNDLKAGKFLCRIGFPFPEFTNFRYNEANDDIEWTKEGNPGSPIFPIEGMVTRFLVDKQKMHGIEMSTPGLRGQSGGPLFDMEGYVLGMQSSTKHLHLGFDIEKKEIRVNGNKKEVSDYSFIHLGQCIHGNILKEFMREKQVKFKEE
jgi:hypothetical protein